MLESQKDMREKEGKQQQVHEGIAQDNMQSPETHRRQKKDLLSQWDKEQIAQQHDMIRRHFSLDTVSHHAIPRSVVSALVRIDRWSRPQAAQEKPPKNITYAALERGMRTALRYFEAYPQLRNVRELHDTLQKAVRLKNLQERAKHSPRDLKKYIRETSDITFNGRDQTKRIMKFVLQGKSNQEIARITGLARNTVTEHITIGRKILEETILTPLNYVRLARQGDNFKGNTGILVQRGKIPGLLIGRIYYAPKSAVDAYEENKRGQIDESALEEGLLVVADVLSVNERYSLYNNFREFITYRNGRRMITPEDLATFKKLYKPKS